MLKNYFKTSWRTLNRRKSVSVINILGLALGICACLIIFLIAKFDLNFDKFHPDKDRIYRVYGILHLAGTSLESFTHKSETSAGSVPYPTSVALRNEVPGFESIAGVFMYDAKVSVADANKHEKIFFKPNQSEVHHIAFVEPQYFDIFKYKLIAGNTTNALSEPFKVVLTEKEAQRYFGQMPMENIIGKRLTYDDSLIVTVSGVVKDWTENTDLKFTDFISWVTISESFIKNNITFTKWSNWDDANELFVKLNKNTQPSQLTSKLLSFSKKYLQPTEFHPEVRLQPLSDIHFNSEIGDQLSRKASLPVLYGLMGIAVFILIIASINFINLSTAQSVQRAKEIGIRKVLGSSKGKLIFQFLSETFLLASFATILAVLFVNPLLKLFYQFIPEGVSFNLTDTWALLFLIGTTVITSLLAGFYPAKVLSSYLPALSLKGQNPSFNNQKGYFRKSLIIFQFTVSILFIIGTLIVGKQIRFMMNTELGFQKDAIINIQTDFSDPIAKRDVLLQKIRKLSNVSATSLSQMPPSAERQNGTFISYKGKNEISGGVQNIFADENFLPFYNIKLVAGHNYTHSDTINQLLINETAAKFLGFKNPDEVIGKFVFIGVSDRPNSSQDFPIVGVVKDFYAQSLHDPIKPLFIAPSSGFSRMINVKLALGNDPTQLKNTIAAIEKIWKQIYPDRTFEYSFFDKTIANFYEKEEKTSMIINAAMIVAIFISCMGLFGLVAFTTEQRTKEIGIRKVLGASVSGITLMICKDFVVLVVISLLISSPIAWYFMHQWLQTYPYRITINMWTFVVAGMAAVCIALITISFQSIKAAMGNPVESLRTE